MKIALYPFCTTHTLILLLSLSNVTVTWLLSDSAASRGSGKREEREELSLKSRDWFVSRIKEYNIQILTVECLKSQQIIPLQGHSWSENTQRKICAWSLPRHFERIMVPHSATLTSAWLRGGRMAAQTAGRRLSHPWPNPWGRCRALSASQGPAAVLGRAAGQNLPAPTAASASLQPVWVVLHLIWGFQLSLRIDCSFVAGKKCICSMTSTQHRTELRLVRRYGHEYKCRVGLSSIWKMKMCLSSRLFVELEKQYSSHFPSFFHV